MKTKLRLLLIAAVLGGAGVIAASAAPGAGAACTGTNCPPGVVAASPFNIGPHQATFSGEVIPGNSTTTCYFQWGTTTAYGNRTATQTFHISKAHPEQPVSALVTGLESVTGYHYQLVCHNSHGTSTGSDVTFTTADTGPSTIALSGHTGFVSSSGVGGVFIGCYGDRTCTGNLTLSRSGSIIGSRSSYSIAPNTGGIIHVRLSSSAFSTLKSRHFYNVSIASTTTDGRALVGGDTGLKLTLHIFS